MTKTESKVLTGEGGVRYRKVWTDDVENPSEIRGYEFLKELATQGVFYNALHAGPLWFQRMTVSLVNGRWTVQLESEEKGAHFE